MSAPCRADGLSTRSVTRQTDARGTSGCPWCHETLGILNAILNMPGNSRASRESSGSVGNLINLIRCTVPRQCAAALGAEGRLRLAHGGGPQRPGATAPRSHGGSARRENARPARTRALARDALGHVCVTRVSAHPPASCAPEGGHRHGAPPQAGWASSPNLNPDDTVLNQMLRRHSSSYIPSSGIEVHCHVSTICCSS